MMKCMTTHDQVWLPSLLVSRSVYWAELSLSFSHGIVNTLRDSVVTVVTEQVITF